MLFAFVPPSFILASVGPAVNTVSFLLIRNELSFILQHIGIDVNPVALHLVVDPLTVVLSAVPPQVNAVPVDLVVQPVSFVGASIVESVLAPAFLARGDIRPFEFGSFRPSFLAFAVLLVVSPLTNIGRSLLVDVSAVTISFVVAPVTIVCVSVRMEKLPSSTRLIVTPFSFIASTVRPYHRASSVSQVTLPLAGVDRASPIVVSALLQWRILIKFCLCQRLKRLFRLEVLADRLISQLLNPVLASFQETPNMCLNPAKRIDFTTSRFFLLNPSC